MDNSINQRNKPNKYKCLEERNNYDASNIISFNSRQINSNNLSESELSDTLFKENSFLQSLYQSIEKENEKLVSELKKLRFQSNDTINRLENEIKKVKEINYKELKVTKSVFLRVHESNSMWISYNKYIREFDEKISLENPAVGILNLMNDKVILMKENTRIRESYEPNNFIHTIDNKRKKIY